MIIAIFNTFFCSFFIIYSYKRMKKMERISLLGLTSLIFVAINGLPLPFIEYSPVSYYHYKPSDVALGRAFISISIFMFICILFQQITFKNRRPKCARKICLTPLSVSIYFGFFFLAMVAFVKFFWLAGTYRYLGSALLDPAYYAARAAISEEFLHTAGKGGWSSHVALYFLFPLIMSFSCLFRRRGGKFYWVIFGISAVAANLIAFVFAHRTDILFSLLYPVFCIYVMKKRDTIEKSILNFRFVKILMVTMILVFITAGAIYQVTNKVSFSEGVLLGIRRIVFVPPMVTTFYYDAFPDKFDYQGLSYLHVLQSSYSSTYRGITTDDIAFKSIGKFSNANTSLLATAYSAMGFFGVFLISIAFYAIVGLVDKLTEKLDNEWRFALLLPNTMGIIQFMSTSLYVSMRTGGFCIVSLLGYAIILTGVVYRNRQVVCKQPYS